MNFGLKMSDTARQLKVFRPRLLYQNVANATPYAVHFL